MGCANTNDFGSIPRINVTGEGAPAVYCRFDGIQQGQVNGNAVTSRIWSAVTADPYKLARFSVGGSQPLAIEVPEAGYYDVAFAFSGIATSAANRCAGQIYKSTSLADAASPTTTNSTVLAAAQLYWSSSSSAEVQTLTVIGNLVYLKKGELISVAIKPASASNFTVLEQESYDSWFTVKLVQKEQKNGPSYP